MTKTRILRRICEDNVFLWCKLCNLMDIVYDLIYIGMIGQYWTYVERGVINFRQNISSFAGIWVEYRL